MLEKSGVPLALALLRQSRSLIRFSLRSSAHPQGFEARGQIRDREREREQVTARTNGFWGQIAISLRSEAKHPKGGPKARGICALTPKTPVSVPAPPLAPEPVRAEPVEALRCVQIGLTAMFRHRSAATPTTRSPDLQAKPDA